MENFSCDESRRFIAPHVPHDAISCRKVDTYLKSDWRVFDLSESILLLSFIVWQVGQLA